MSTAAELERVSRDVVACRACPRLVTWRELVAAEPRASFANETYWARPVPGFGDPHARVLVVGLAPAAHGGNRTGRIFTGDRSGDWLFGSLHRSGFANQPLSIARGDGLTLEDAYITSVVRCAPPRNRPTVDERDRCIGYLEREMRLLERLRVIVALGSFAWDGALIAVGRLSGTPIRPKPRFGHGAEADLGPVVVVGSYHPSQQNTFTGKLTAQMLDDVFDRARALVGR